MKGTRAFTLALSRQALRATLDGALIAGKGARYVAARTSVVGLRAILRTGVHAAEVVVLTRDFPFEFLVPLFAVRALPSFVTGVQWGALETLRSGMRSEVRGGRPQAARAMLECWLACTGLCALALFALLTTRIALLDEEHGPNSLLGSFIILCAFTLAVELWTRTYHAGVFALGRVYRPPWTLFVPDALELGLLVLSYPRLGPFALHLMVLLGTLLRAGITVGYSRRAYRTRGLPRAHPLRLSALRRLAVVDLWASARHAVAALPFMLDRMLLLALLSAPPASPAALPLALPYYALRPIAGFAQSWVRTFYADFVRLDVSSIKVLRVRFERMLARAALVTGALSALSIVVGARFLFGPLGIDAALWLAPLSLLRSRFALEQTRAFSYHRVGVLVRTGLFLLAGLLLAERLALSDRAMLAALLLMLGVVQVVFGRVASRAAARRLELASRLPLSAWLAHLVGQERPVRVSVAMVDARVASRGALLRVLAQALDEGRVARLGKAWTLWWEPRDRATPRAKLAALLGGAVAELGQVEAASGKLALEEAQTEGVLPGGLARALARPRDPQAREHLLARARSLIPGVLVLDARHTSPELARLGARDLTIVRRVITAEAREQGIVPSFCPWQAAVYAPGGEAELVFVWPAHTAHAGTLSREVREASWRDSLA